MRNLFYTLLICLVFISCERSEPVQPIDNETQRTLSAEELVLKANLDATAKLLVQLIEDKDIQKELRNFSVDKNDQYNIYFRKLANPSKDDKYQFPELYSKFSKLVSQQKGNEDLLQYLIDNNCSIYIPYPLDWYPADKKLTVVANPIDNEDLNILFIHDA